MIKLQVIGHLGKDCTVNIVNGKNVINFNVAHSEKFKDSQGVQKDRTTWVDCAYWSDRTGIAPYLKKGTQVYAEGYPDVRAYTTQDGRQGASLSMRVISVQLLGSRSNEGVENQDSGNNSYQQNEKNNSSSSNEPEDSSDDLPF